MSDKIEAFSVDTNQVFLVQTGTLLLRHCRLPSSPFLALRQRVGSIRDDLRSRSREEVLGRLSAECFRLRVDIHLSFDLVQDRVGLLDEHVKRLLGVLVVLQCFRQPRLDDGSGKLVKLLLVLVGQLSLLVERHLTVAGHLGSS